MTAIRSQKDKDLIYRLEELTQEIKNLTKESENIKNYLKEKYEEGAYTCNLFAVAFESKARCYIDKALVIKEFGMEGLKKVEKSTSYKTIKITKK